ncbi:acetylornithine deacetylase [Exophiala aquamarina CBS 119918]|uniref:Acetylornithine deacetylase n=1 Tax=Exophiala aquamarina CBS 119918 TaxID=1182545 RepID=A0A072PTZ9_9EURO|nr:acetylornithine deacetylase [Exophiala aquamarina CBS 119918]KEF62783.1 acetylornithine deacetylase [Exophiala aquamarina CBS 119918]
MKMLKATATLLLAVALGHASGLSDVQEPIIAASLNVSGNGKLSEVIASSPLLSLHRAICEVESVSDNELPVAKLIIKFLEAHNFTVKTQSVPPPDATNDTQVRWNIYAYPDPSKYGGSQAETSQPSPKILLSSHIDTVPPHIPYSLSLPKKADDGQLSSSRKNILISGRGTVDDKACVAVQIQTILDLLANHSTEIDPSDLALLLVVGEEQRGDGMRHFSNSELYRKTKSNYKAVLFGEPTEGKLAAGHKGIFMVKVNAHGKAAHSGYPWLGRSANSMILPTLLTLDKLGDVPEAEGGLPRSEKFGKSTVNVGYVRGGVAGNVVPEFATADVTFRLAGGTPEEVQHIVREAIRAADPEDLLDLEFSQGYGPISLDADVEGFDTITVNYGTDIPNLELLEGVKRYLYGPGSILVAHGRNEGLTVGDLEEALKGYKSLVQHALRS